ncbi:hypothetical protein ACFQJ5_07545 [Halomicroarcula sp. GCM10025324]|uniref:hypothetical protein n=1 Tax=Haloarcula TaxID=2237 RepID=UPI0023E7B376|nr:hypothetical protein [Halomicroarcula sp. ZS-22-S1]
MLHATPLPSVIGDSAPATLTTDIVVGILVAVGLFALYYKLVLLRAKRGRSRDASNDGGTSRRDTGN